MATLWEESADFMCGYNEPNGCVHHLRFWEYYGYQFNKRMAAYAYFRNRQTELIVFTVSITGFLPLLYLLSQLLFTIEVCHKRVVSAADKGWSYLKSMLYYYADWRVTRANRLFDQIWSDQNLKGGLIKYRNNPAHQTLEWVCVQEGRNDKNIVLDLLQRRDTSTLIHIAAENGLVTPIFELLSNRDWYMDSFLTDPLLQRDSNGLSVVHSALKGPNLPLNLLIVGHLNPLQLLSILSLECKEPAINIMINEGIEKFQVYREFCSNYVLRQAEPFTLMSRTFRNRTNQGEIVLNFGGDTDSTILEWDDDVYNLKNMYHWNTWSDATSLTSMVQTILNCLHRNNFFCKFDISDPADFVEYLISPLSAEQRRDVYLTKNTVSGETPLHCAIIKGDTKSVSLILESLDDNETFCSEIIAATNIAGESSLHTALLHDKLEIFIDILQFLPDDAQLEVFGQEDKEYSRTVLETAITLHPYNQLIESIVSPLEPYELYQLLKHKDNKGTTSLHSTLKTDNGRSIFEILLEELSTEHQLELLEIPDSCGASTVDLARRAKKGGALRETSRWVLERYSSLQTELILGEEDLETQKKMLRKLIKYGQSGLSLDDIEALTDISDTYIIPNDQSLAKPYGLVYYTTRDRDGATEEANTIMQAFESLNITGLSNSWENFDQLRVTFSDKLEEIKDEGCFLIVTFMAHGFKGHLVGEDGSRGKINDLIDLVDLQISPAVPVVFLVQSCQQSDRGACQIVLKRPHSALLAATVPGGPAARGAFLPAVASAMSQTYGRLNPHDILINAVSEMKDKHKTDPTVTNQTPEVRSTLQKFLEIPWRLR